MGVSEAGHGEVERDRPGRRRVGVTLPHHETGVVRLEVHAAQHATVAQQAIHPDAHDSSRIDCARASTPAATAATSAPSSGACETPDGLRTNSIAVGTWAESTPAS